MTPPPPPADARSPDQSGARVYAVAAAILLALLAYRGYAPQAESRPSELVAAGLDPGRADAAELGQLPGFGPARANAVVTHRANYAPDQPLERVPGVGPATAERARPFLIPATDTLTRKQPEPAKLGKVRRGDPPIDINRASESELMRLPGVGKTLAARIADARPFADVEDLRRVKGVGAKTLENLRPFVVRN